MRVSREKRLGEGRVGSWAQGVEGRLITTLRRGEEPKVCKIFYLERFVFTSWLIGAFDF